MFMYYTVCYFTGIFYAFVRQISMLFIDNKDFGFCNLLRSYFDGHPDITVMVDWAQSTKLLTYLLFCLKQIKIKTRE